MHSLDAGCGRCRLEKGLVDQMGDNVYEYCELCFFVLIREHFEYVQNQTSSLLRLLAVSKTSFLIFHTYDLVLVQATRRATW